jgi:transketolase N-terminal domain/subunit
VGVGQRYYSCQSRLGDVLSRLGRLSEEGNNAEAARLAVAQGLDVKLFIDDNDVTIAGHPSEYLRGSELEKTLKGHGLKAVVVDEENFNELWGAVTTAVSYNGPAAQI